MGAAEIISFEEVRARKQWRTLRQQLHKRFDQWLDTLEQQWHEPPSTLTEVTATVWDWRQQLTGGIPRQSWRMSTAVHTTARRSPGRGVMDVESPRTRLPHGRNQWWGQCSVSDPISIVGPVAWAAIPSMKRGGRGGYKQLDMHKAAAQLVTEVPYDTAQRFFAS